MVAKRLYWFINRICNSRYGFVIWTNIHQLLSHCTFIFTIFYRLILIAKHYCDVLGRGDTETQSGSKICACIPFSRCRVFIDPPSLYALPGLWKQLFWICEPQGFPDSDFWCKNPPPPGICKPPIIFSPIPRQINPANYWYCDRILHFPYGGRWAFTDMIDIYQLILIFTDYFISNLQTYVFKK